MVENSLRGGFRAPFHSVADKEGLWTETDYFVPLKHPDGKKKNNYLNTKAVLNDLLY